MSGPTRPRFGIVVRADGSRIPLVFRPDPRDPTHFVGVHAGDERPVRLPAGEEVEIGVDVIGPGQSVAVEIESVPA